MAVVLFQMIFFLILDIEYYNNDSSVFLTSSDNASDNSIIWHARLGHIGQERMTRLAREGLIDDIDVDAHLRRRERKCL